MSKHQKLICILSFIIHWCSTQFVKAMTMMAQVMKEQSFWNSHGCLFAFFLLCGCNCMGDGMKWADDGDKEWVIGKLSTKIMFYHSCVFLSCWWNECPHFALFIGFVRLSIFKFCCTCETVDKSLDTIEYM